MSNTLLIIPKNILESIGMSLLLGVIIYAISFGNNSDNLIAMVWLYAISLYRLLPAITKILASYNMILFLKPSLKIVYNDLIHKYDYEDNNNIEFNDCISINKVSFSYNEKFEILKDVSLKIKKGQSIAFIGETGSGKSTFVDIICGIYRPISGNFL